MERRFTTDEFEQFLKQEADNFKMVPSKKVWRGIYNDIHPGRRWPSIAISLLLISTLIFIGHINTPDMSVSHSSENNIVHNHKTVSSQINRTAGSHQAKSGSLIFIKPGPGNDQTSLLTTTSWGPKTAIAQGNTLENSGQSDSPTAMQQLQTGISLTKNNDVADAKSDISTRESDSPVRLSVAPEISQDIVAAEIATINSPGSELINQKIQTDDMVSSEPGKQVRILNGYLSAPEFIEGNGPVVTEVVTAAKSNSDKKVQSVGNAKSATTASISARNNKISYTYFIGPAVTNVLFRGAPISPSVVLSTTVSIMPSNNKVLNHAAFGFEAGAQMNYAFAAKWKFTTGLHLTYSGYNIRSNEMHPTVATLILRDPASNTDYSKTYFSHYGDGSGLTQVNIKNHSVQASMPVGLQYQFFTGDKVQLNASADIEPSLVLGSYAYLLSSDGRNYVNDPSLMRKTNMASNFGVFLSFGSKKFSWQVGPVVRYQWFSTYKANYTISEHLLNYGIRIGITPFRK